VALLAWLVFPLLAAVICIGIGLLAERAAGAALEPALLAPLGYAAAIAVLAPLAATGAGATPSVVLLVVLALAGYVAGRAGLAARLRPGPAGAAAALVYAIFITPIALSGSVSFLGYNLLNDTAFHFALVDWVGDHGSHFVHQAPSSFGATINDYVESHYPLGSHELLAALRPLAGLDVSRVYQPFLALSAALTAPALYALLRRVLAVRAALAAAVVASCGQLVFSFALQGGIKELSFIACLAVAAALAAGGEVALMAIAAAALYGIYGIYALPWIAPLALVALWVLRPPLRRAVVAVVVFLVAVAVEVPASIQYWRHGHVVITAGTELGPLAGPLKPLQAAGVWLNGDYRFVPSHSWITYALALAVAALALWGAAVAFRRERTLLLLVVPALAAFAGTAPFSSPYIDAKLLMILSPAVLAAAAAGIGWIAMRRAAPALALVLGLAVLVSDGLAYRVALVAPADRLEELAQIDKRFAGRGPILVNEYEEYTKHFMRRSRGSDPYEGWNAGRAQLRNPKLPVGGHAYDLDELTTSFVERWPLIATRRSPAESRPPSNYRRAWTGRWYEVWERTGAAPAVHVPLGRPPLDPTERLVCGEDDRGSFVAALRPKPLIVPIADAALPAGWYRDAQNPQTLVTNKGGRIAVEFSREGPGRVWLRGRAFRRLEVLIDGRRVGTVRELNGPNQWMDVGPADLPAGRHRLELVRPTRSLRPGDAQRDAIGPIAIVPATAPRLTRGAAALRACGSSADWLDLAAG
jgi:hypothetical protein